MRPVWASSEHPQVRTGPRGHRTHNLYSVVALTEAEVDDALIFW